MDGSITTPYFFRDGKWLTPHTECGGQQGTTRRWAIDQGLCTAAFIPFESLRRDEIIWLSNGVKGFFTARVVTMDGGFSRTPSYDSRTSSGFSEASDVSSRSSIATHHHVEPCSPVVSSEQVDDEDYEDDIEIRRKYPPTEGADVFRKSAFSLDVFERATKL